MFPLAPLTTPDWQAAVRRRTQFYLLIAFLLAVLPVLSLSKRSACWSFSASPSVYAKEAEELTRV